MLKPIRTSAPSVALFSLPEAKAFSNIDHADDDELVTSLINAATQYLDGYSGILGRCLVNQTWRQDYRNFSLAMCLPFPDVSAAVITYLDPAGQEQTVSGENYTLMNGAGGCYVRFRPEFTYPSVKDADDAIRISMTAGYGPAASDVPEPISTAAKILVSFLYENRGSSDVGDVPFPVTALTAPYCIKHI